MWRRTAPAPPSATRSRSMGSSGPSAGCMPSVVARRSFRISRVGSVKAQIGHLEAAAGLAGLLKTVLALAHRAIPGSPYLTVVNPHIDLADACFRFSSETTPWGEPAVPGQPRRAGVSSFGFGGVNAHVVLEEGPPPTLRTSPSRGAHLFVLSAKTADALRTRSSALATALGDADVCGRTGRADLPRRPRVYLAPGDAAGAPARGGRCLRIRTCDAPAAVAARRPGRHLRDRASGRARGDEPFRRAKPNSRSGCGRWWRPVSGASSLPSG